MGRFRDPLPMKPYQETALPEGASVSLLQTIFIDLYFTEDFDRLRRGLETIRQKYRLPNSAFFLWQRELDDWFAGVISGTAGWMSVGDIVLPHGSAHIKMHALGPSGVCVTVAVLPDQAFSERLQRLLSSNAKSDRFPTCTSILRQRWMSTGTNATDIRQQEVEALLLELNWDVVKLLRRHVNAGWAMSGALPSLDVFVLESGTQEEFDRNGFWDALEMPPRADLPYSRDGVILFRRGFRRGRKPLTHHRRVLVESGRFLSDADLKSYGTKQNALAILLDYTLQPYCLLVALLRHVRLLNDRAAKLRSELAPVLATRKKLGRWFRLKRALRRAEELAFLRYERKRLETEAGASDLVRLTGGYLKGFSREKLSDADEGDLITNYSWQVQRQLKALGDQLDLLREVYHDRLSFGMQGASRLVAIAALLVAITGVLARIPDWAWRRLADWIRKFGN